MTFVAFMTSKQGRAVRVIMGIILMSVGLLVVQDIPGIVLAVIAVVPIAGGLLDFCVAGFMMGYPFRGDKAREQLTREQRR